LAASLGFQAILGRGSKVVYNGRRGKDCDLPLNPALLETLRTYWRRLKPRTYFFPSRLHRDGEQPISDKIVCLHMPVGHGWNSRASRRIWLL